MSMLGRTHFGVMELGYFDEFVQDGKVDILADVFDPRKFL